MADYQEVIKQFWRLCHHYRVDICCANCPLEEVRGVCHCWRWISEEPEKAEQLIMTWAKENPVKTNRDKFKKVFGFDPFTVDLFGTAWFEKEYKEPKDD